MPRTSFAEARAISGGRLVEEFSAKLAILDEPGIKRTRRQYNSVPGRRQGEKRPLSKRYGTSAGGRCSWAKPRDRNGRGQSRKIYANLRPLLQREDYGQDQQKKSPACRFCVSGYRR